MIQVKNLTKYYGPTLAVDDISFHIDEGEIVGFLGPNGAGKSTTLRILTSYQPATRGAARVAGFDVLADSMRVRQHVGYLPENVPLYPEMRVREYLNFRGKLRGLGRADRLKAIASVTDRCWLGEFVDRPIGQLSKGMRQRVGLADALLHDPKVLILDEPTIGLDPAQIRETRKLIQELATRHTVLLSTHILPEVEQICNRTIIIAAGSIVASGTPAELRERISGRSRLIAELRGPTASVAEAVKRIAGVKSVESSTNGDWARMAIETADARDVREEVFRLAVAKQWPLREIRREVASLEEFFVHIVAKQAEARRL